mmetsp:Transcript_9406/g.21549  ORF Transcript_9406/g.21549 Transcript_9406/m.21549 type:complete len:286 (-) Transcript_9406:1658-2515(-)
MHDNLRPEVLCHPRGLELEGNAGPLEPGPLGLFRGWFLPRPSAGRTQFLLLHPRRELLFRPRADVRFGPHGGNLGAAVCVEQIPRTHRHFLHHYPQKAAHLVALVPPHFRPGVLLALVRDQGTPRDHLLRHELRRSRDHVFLLLFDGRQAQAQVVQQHVHHRGPDLADGRGRHGDDPRLCPPEVPPRPRVQHEDGKQRRGYDHVRELPVPLPAILFPAVLWEKRQGKEDQEGIKRKILNTKQSPTKKGASFRRLPTKLIIITTNSYVGCVVEWIVRASARCLLSK